MNNELQSLNERIAERIGKDLVDLIPADQWQKLVDNEVAKFNRETAPKIINDLLKDAYVEKAKQAIDKLTAQTGWDTETQSAIHGEIEEFIGKSSGVIVAAMLTSAMGQVLYNLRQQLGY